MNDILLLANEFNASFLKNKLKFATAESCTGGLIAASITEISGSSQWFDRGFVTYTNEAKMQMLGVEAKVLSEYGAVSIQVAKQMALGAILHSSADIAVAVTGIAGPSGGTEQKPVGTVCIGFAKKNQEVIAKRHLFLGSRAEVRYQTVVEALRGMLLLADKKALNDYN